MLVADVLIAVAVGVGVPSVALVLIVIAVLVYRFRVNSLRCEPIIIPYLFIVIVGIFLCDYSL